MPTVERVKFAFAIVSAVGTTVSLTRMTSLNGWHILLFLSVSILIWFGLDFYYQSSKKALKSATGDILGAIKELSAIVKDLGCKHNDYVREAKVQHSEDQMSLHAILGEIKARLPQESKTPAKPDRNPLGSAE